MMMGKESNTPNINHQHTTALLHVTVPSLKNQKKFVSQQPTKRTAKKTSWKHLHCSYHLSLTDPFLLSPRLWPRKHKHKHRPRKQKRGISLPVEKEISPMLAGPSWMSQNDPLEDFSKHWGSSVEEAEEAEGAEGAEEEAGTIPTQTTTPTPSPLKPQAESSMARNQ